MAYTRTLFPKFILANSAYASATVAFYRVDPLTRAITDTLVMLYDSQTGAGTLTNPLTLGADGRSQSPIYVDEPVIARVNSAAVGSHDTGVFNPQSGKFRGTWAAGVEYWPDDLVSIGDAGPNQDNQYACREYHSAGNDFTTDLVDGKWALAIDAQSVFSSAATAAAAAAQVVLGGKLNTDGDGSAVMVAGRSLASHFGDTVNPRNVPFAAVGDGMADDAQALQKAADALAIAGGGEMFLPPGIYLLGSSPSASTYGLLLPSNVLLRGAGRGKTTIKVADGANIGCVAGTDVMNVSIRDLTIDGNKANNTSGLHGIRFGGTCSDIEVADVTIRNAASYGIGFQNAVGNSGVFRRVRISRVTIDSPAADGVDVKNVANGNEDLQISDITVLSPTGTGVDVRGPALLSNVNVKLTVANSTGIQFRGTDVSGNGTGGRYGSLVNFYVDCGSVSSTDGLVIDDPYVTAANGHVANAAGAGVWLTTTAANAQITNVSVSGSTNGFLVEGANATLVNCFGLSNGSDALSSTTNTLGCAGISGGVGLTTPPGSAGSPAFRSTGDQNTGLFFPAADTIALALGGAQRMTWDSAGRSLLGSLGISVATYNATAAQCQQAGTSAASATYSIQRYSPNASEAVWEFVKSRGGAGSHGAVVSGDYLGTLRWVGSDGASWLLGAFVSAVVDGVPGTNDLPTRLVFATTPDGSATPQERMRIDNAGRVILYALPTSATGLVAGTLWNDAGTLKVV